ncbi:MAG: CotH kinase family protein [Wujia sp.]
MTDYEEFAKLVDVESVMDYFAVEVWINNKWDWPGKNWSMWRTVTVDENNEYGDGRWRFSLYDIEFGGVCGESEAYTNTIREDNYKPKGLLDMGTSNPAVLCFAYLMTNDSFKEAYCDRLKRDFLVRDKYTDKIIEYCQ